MDQLQHLADAEISRFILRSARLSALLLRFILRLSCVFSTFSVADIC